MKKIETSTTKRLKGNSITSLIDNYCSIDIETTGLSPNQNSIIEIGIIKVRDKKIIDSYQQLINPGFKIPQIITMLTGITDKMLIGCPSISDVLLETKKFIGDDILLGHNICSFDSTFLYDHFLRSCDYIMKNDMIDLLQLSRGYFPLCENYKLQTLLQYLKIPQITRHRALADAENTYLCYEVIKKLLHEKTENLANSIYIDTNVNFSKKGIDYKDLAATTTLTKIDDDFFGKCFVFTGALCFSREEACKIVLAGGGKISPNITKTVDFLVDANPDVSNKKIRARELIEQGYPIKIITENEFLEMINNNT